MDNSNKIILDLCGGSGSWSKPYKDAGYDVRVITLPDYDVRTYRPPEIVYGVLAAPPCTEFSVLNCVAAPRERDEKAGLEIVKACLSIINSCHPTGFWALENPRGFLREAIRPYFNRPPKLTFQPWWYGDSWTKGTDIWGDFKLPKRLYQDWEDVPKLPLYTRPGRGKPNFAFLHKSAIKEIPQLQGYEPENDAAFRAITPPGFAKAFYEVNK